MKNINIESLCTMGMLIVLIVVIILGCVMCAHDSTPEPEVEKAETSEVEVSDDNNKDNPVRIADEPEPEPAYTEDELFCMAAAIYNEAGGDAWSDDTRRLVGYVILNRVNDSRYPNTIREVLEQRWQYGRFCITGVKFADRHTLPQEKHAVDRAYRIAKEVLEMEEVPIPKEVIYQAEFQQGTSLYKYQDGFYFCCA